MFISGLDVPHSERQRRATLPTLGDGAAIVKVSNSSGTVPFIARLYRTAQMQMLAFQERVWTRSAITLAPVLQVTRRVCAQNTDTTATGRVAACHLPSTMPIPRLSTLPCSRRLSPMSAISVTAWTAHLTRNRSFTTTCGAAASGSLAVSHAPGSDADGHLQKLLVPGSTGVSLSFETFFHWETQGTAKKTTPRQVTSCRVASMTLRRRFLRQLTQDSGRF